MSEKERLEALSRQIAAAIEKTPPRPSLRLVGREDLEPKSDRWMDDATRESYVRFILDLGRAYRHCGLHLVTRHALAGKTSIYDLSDNELMSLHRDMHRGLDCIRNDVPFEHAGLIGEENACAWGT